MHYSINFMNSALKELRKLSKEVSEQIARDINELEKNPRPHGHRKLKGNENLYRIRSGNYRVVYKIEDKVLIVLVVRIGDRRDVYRNI